MFRSDLRQTFSPMAGHPIDFVKLDDVLIRGITLPPVVEAAINRKEEQKQLNLEYDYRLLREAKETERKRIEAQGIREFQDIVSSGITDSYLRWKGIEATLELARSNNAKMVIVGGGKGGLPIILGNMDGGASKESTPANGNLPPGPAETEDSLPTLPAVGDGGNAPPVPATPGTPTSRSSLRAPSTTTPNSSPAMAPVAPGATPPLSQPTPTKQSTRNR